MMGMPKKAWGVCNQQGCPELTRDGYCEKHKGVVDKDYRINRTDKREQAFYKSGDWIKVRNYKRMMNPLCEHCMRTDELTPLDVIDHIIPIKVNWSLRFTLSNLQSLCQGCHNIKSIEDRKLYHGLI